jgi:hypothetical protein
MPLQIKPPIGPKFMMHMWSCKEETPDKDFFYKRFLKKKNVPCTFTWDEDPASNLGWELHFVESLHISLIICILFGFTVAAGLIFSISWAILRDDLSGAYTIASYLTALMTLLLMAVMSAIAAI